MVSRIQNAEGNGLEVGVDRVDGSLRSRTGKIPVHYFVVEDGVYTDEEYGVNLEAIQARSTVTDWMGRWTGQRSSLSNSYINPVILVWLLISNARNSVTMRFELRRIFCIWRRDNLYLPMKQQCIPI